MATRMPDAATPVPVIRTWGVTGWYTMVFCTVFAYSVLPIFAAVLANKADWPTVTLAIALVTAIVDGALLWYPATWLLTTVVDFFRRLRGLKPLADMTEEERQNVTERMYVRLVTYAYIKAAIFFFLACIPIRGNEELGVIVTILGVLVILGAPVFADRHPWVGKFLYHKAWVILTLALVAMVLLAFNPELRPAARVAGAQGELRAKMEKQRGVWLSKEIGRIKGLMADMGQKEPWLTEEERVEKLPLRDREIWNEGTRGWVKAQVANTRERLLPSIKETWLAVIGQGDSETLGAHKAIDKVRADQERAILHRDLGEALKCYTDLNGLGRNPTPAEWENCEAKRRDVGKSVTSVTPTPPKSTAAGQLNGESQSATPAATAPAAPVRTAQAEPTWECNTTWKEVDYAPSEHQGRMDLGMLPAGRYAIKVTGTVWQDFYTGTPAVFHQRCEADPDGRMGDCRAADNRLILNRNGDIWPAPRPIPSASRVHIPGEAYGKFLFLVNGWPALPVGETGTVSIPSDRPVAVDVNFYQHPASYNGPGQFRVTIKQCQQT